MADDVTLPATGSLIAADQVATINGGAATAGLLVQRVKAGFGADGDFKDVNSTNPLPVSSADLGATADASATTDTGTFSLIALFKRLLSKIPGLGNAAAAASTPVTQAVETASGTITTQNLVPAGAATAGSAVAITLNGTGTLMTQVTGTYTGVLSLQGTVDGATWVTFGGSGAVFTNINTGAQSNTIASAATGIFVADVSGFSQVRATGLAAMTGTATVTLRAVQAGSVVGIDLPLPAGTNAIGSVTVAAGQQGTAATASLNPVTVSGVNNANQVARVLVDITADNGTTSGRAVITAAPSNNVFGLLGSSARTTSGNIAVSQSVLGLQLALNVTAASGTTPSLDVVLQESLDAGTTWYDVYHFERVTATGQIISAPIALNSFAKRLVWTIAGTTPSFTFSVNQTSMGVPPRAHARKFFDRTANLINGTNGTNGTAFNLAGCDYVYAVVSLGAATAPASYKVQGSLDGANWFDMCASTAAVANAQTAIVATNVQKAPLVRVTCSAGGTAQTGNHVGIYGS